MMHRNESWTWLARRFELSRGSSDQNVRPMEGLRGFAVFLVFLVHYVTLAQPWMGSDPLLASVTSAIHALGNTGVDLFFVLSGYLIYGSLISRPPNFRIFICRRIERIYPAFVAVFTLYVVLSLLLPEQSKIPTPASSGLAYLLANFFLLPGIFSIDPMITVAWSLSYEMFFYLVMPAVIGCLSLRECGSKWRIAFFAALAIAAAIYGASAGGHIRLIMFISGVLLYEAIRGIRAPSPGSAIGLTALVLGLLSTALPVHGSAGAALKVGILFIAFFLLCLACFQSPNAWLARGFAWTPLRWLGNMSYSYYLLHGLALKAAFLALAVPFPAERHASWPFFWALLPAMFLLTLVPTAMLFLLVERPFSLAKSSRLPGPAKAATPLA